MRAQARRDPDLVDESTAPVWVSPEDDLKVHKAALTNDPLYNNAPLPLIRPAKDPEGCTTRTMVLQGVYLSNSVEQYAQLGRHYFSTKLSLEQASDIIGRGLAMPKVTARRVLVEELDRRARGQGVWLHNPAQGGYDPRKPWDSEVADLPYKEWRSRFRSPSPAPASPLPPAAPPGAPPAGPRRDKGKGRADPAPGQGHIPMMICVDEPGRRHNAVTIYDDEPAGESGTMMIPDFEVEEDVIVPMPGAKSYWMEPRLK
ncbi:hypothetical protein OC835_007883 [Tilletia horrida]|nr:hypothetical protein OC835_007883 [Tilletia horrida]